MGKSWDDSGVAYSVDMWRGLLDLLHPGGFGMAFGGTRTYHRLACAIEDAGAELHPLIYGWAFGSGFPKATRIDSQIDERAGKKGTPSDYQPNGKNKVYGAGMGGGFTTNAYQPATPTALAWKGHRYGKQALKPAVEPICCFQRPYEGRPIDCITETGAGSLWIDGGRVEGAKGSGVWGSSQESGKMSSGNCLGKGWDPAYRTQPHPQGRWPANFVLQHLPACNGTCAEGCPVKALGEQSGERKGGSFPAKLSGSSMFGLDGLEQTQRNMSDTGTAARFFQQVGWQLDHAEPVKYQAKASRSERDAGLEGRPMQSSDYRPNDPAENSLRTRIHNSIPRHNPHPTVKPLELTRYLATLLLPPAEYAPRRILIPFGGVGSEAIGALLAGWDEVVMVEQSQEYCEIAKARIAWWQANMERYETTDTKEIRKLAKRRKKRRRAQRSLL